MSFSTQLPQPYTFSLCIAQGNRTLVNTRFEAPATTDGVAKVKRTIQRLMNEYVPDSETTWAAAPEHAPEKKPEGARGLLHLYCPECGRTFGTILREYQTEIACKCGHQIDLTGQLGRYHFTCPSCQHEGWGKTNSEEPEIEVQCKCREKIRLQWVPGAKEYQN